MQIQNTENRFSNTNFRAVKVLRTITKTAKDKHDIVEIYRLSAKDKPFIKRCIDVTNGKDRSIPDNACAIYYDEPKKTFRKFFNNILKPKFEDREQSFIAIRNNNEICGVANIYDWGNPGKITDFLVLRDSRKSAVKKGLLYTILKAGSCKNELVINSANCNTKAAIFFKKHGFYSPKEVTNSLIIDSPLTFNIQIKNLKKDKDVIIKNVSDKNEYDLQKVLDLD